ncbi:MAG: phosphopantetheine-binding protein [Burkholderiales bacterium]|nr:phosphopantetheine-binding protein [Burkholderiales bacterium]
MSAPDREQLRAAIFEAIGAIAPEVDPADIRPDQPLRQQVDLDSFDFLNVIIRLHENLGIDIPESDYGELQTLDRAVDYLVRRCGSDITGK